MICPLDRAFQGLNDWGLRYIANLIQCSVTFVFFFYYLQELVVRVCFILGNLASKSEDVRDAIFFDDSFLEVILSVMQTYFNFEMEVRHLNSFDIHVCFKNYIIVLSCKELFGIINATITNKYF